MIPTPDGRREALRTLAGALAAPMAGAWAATAGARARAADATAEPRPLGLAPDEARRYRLVFRDEFDVPDLGRFNEQASGGAPGAPAWRSRYRWSRAEIINGEKQAYVDPQYAGSGPRPLGVQPFSIARGVLTITAQPADPARVRPFLGAQGYTSGCITTELTHWQTYGFFEMRARLPAGKGFWPAFWLLPRREAGYPEIDVLEGSGARPGMVHCGVIDAPPGEPSHTSGWVRGGPEDASGFGVFGMAWTPEAITVFHNGRQVLVRRGHRVHEDMYLLANLAVGSRDAGWIPDPDDSTPFPGRFEIDYIRAFQRVPG
jgi:beta-glucanase (GH16 family)